MDTVFARTSVLPVVIEHDGKENTYQLQATTDNAVGLKMLNLDPRDHPEVMEVEFRQRGGKGRLEAGRPHPFICRRAHRQPRSTD